VSKVRNNLYVSGRQGDGRARVDGALDISIGIVLRPDIRRQYRRSGNYSVNRKRTLDAIVSNTVFRSAVQVDEGQSATY